MTLRLEACLFMKYETMWNFLINHDHKSQILGVHRIWIVWEYILLHTLKGCWYWSMMISKIKKTYYHLMKTNAKISNNDKTIFNHKLQIHELYCFIAWIYVKNSNWATGCQILYCRSNSIIPACISTGTMTVLDLE